MDKTIRKKENKNLMDNLGMVMEIQKLYDKSKTFRIIKMALRKWNL